MRKIAHNIPLDISHYNNSFLSTKFGDGAQLTGGFSFRFLEH